MIRMTRTIGLVVLLATGSVGSVASGCGKYGRPIRPAAPQTKAEAPAEAPIEIEPDPPVVRDSRGFMTNQQGLGQEEEE